MLFICYICSFHNFFIVMLQWGKGMSKITLESVNFKGSPFTYLAEYSADQIWYLVHALLSSLNTDFCGSFNFYININLK